MLLVVESPYGPETGMYSFKVQSDEVLPAESRPLEANQKNRCRLDLFSSSLFLRWAIYPSENSAVFRESIIAEPEAQDRTEKSIAGSTTVEGWIAKVRPSLHFPMASASFPAVDTAIGVRVEG